MEIDNKNILNRLKRTEGQIRGIQKMDEEEKKNVWMLSPIKRCSF